MVMNKEQIEKELRGYYRTGCFNIYLRGSFNPVLEKMEKEDLGTFLHEYVHFLQNISTPYGIFEANAHNLQAVETFMEVENLPEIEIPYHPNFSDELQKRILWLKFMNGDPVSESVSCINVDAGKEMMFGIMDCNCRGRKGKNVALRFFDTCGKEHQRMIGALDIKESMAAAYQSLIDPDASHPDIPYDLLRLFCVQNFPTIGKDIKKFICLCYTALFNLQPAYQFIQLCIKAENNPHYTGFELFDEFVNVQKAISGGISLPVHEQFDNILNSYAKSIHGLIRCDMPYIKELLDRARLVDGNVPILNVINTQQPFTVENIKALVSALGIPFMHAENRGWFYPSMNDKGAPDVVHLVGMMMLYDFLTQEKLSLRGICPLSKMCGQFGTYCYDQPWLENDCSFALIGEEIKLKDKLIKVLY